MGQRTRDDKIGSLSHGGGIISLAASRLTIGGQQYTTTSATQRTISTDVTMTANSLYMIYAVVSGGAVQLRISSNVNSVGPAGFLSWKLVGAFYANGLVSPAFGSFVTITGRPVSSRTFYTGSGTWVTNTSYSSSWERDGEFMVVRVSLLIQGGSPNAAILDVNGPSGFTVDTSKTPVGTPIIARALDSGTREFPLGDYYGGSFALRLIQGENATSAGNVSESTPFVWTTDDEMHSTARIAITGWSNTPLEDL